VSALDSTALARTLHERFFDVAAARGGQVAIRTPRASIRYRELAEFALRISAAVTERRPLNVSAGVAPAAILLPQGISAIAAQLGVLRAGGFFVALDPRQPEARLAATIAHCGATTLLTDAKFFTLAETIAPPGAVVFDVEAIGDRRIEGNFRASSGPDALAYVYYTSGSTGAPKGVADTHRNVLHNVLRYTTSLALDADDRLTLLQSPAFSGAVSSTYGALLNGATLCPFDLVDDGGDRLADWLVECGATVYHSVPSIFRALVAGRRDYPALRIVRLEGDRAIAEDARLFQQHFARRCTLVNGLGTTETGIARQYFIAHDTPIDDGLLPIGYPVADVDAAIVDAQGHSAAAGAIGEIVVKSRYLALGYWRDPALTAARFAVENDERTYRTGDLGRMRADGCLEYLGRADRALRIHGQQVDPVAIEQALVALDLVGDAVVVARERVDGNPSLVAFVVIDTAAMIQRPTREQLRDALPAGLRDGALPIAFVLREALPLTAFGKVDRAALAALAKCVDLAPEGGDATTSEDALEASIARIWCESLGRASVASDVSFLDYGGDSLNAMSILSRVREHLAADLDVREFFATPTVADQARLVAAVRASARARAPTTWNASASTTSAHTITGPDGISSAVDSVRPIA